MDEKLYMTASRMTQLHSFKYPGITIPPEKTLEYKLEAEKRFGNCLFVPLDIPVIQDDLFTEWYWENAKPIKKLLPSIATYKICLLYTSDAADE